ncbi:MAG: hypothetical protein HQK65_08320, partial [Desulfamplus sp.]|nr:hypothetical protein [Desulfamplus sp.]
KAELYLPSGFKNLTCQRLKVVISSDSRNASDSRNTSNSRNTSDSSTDSVTDLLSPLWVEIFLYDMQLSDNAFSVFSRQRRENADPVSIAQYGYQTENALFFAHGRFYVEMIASVPSKEAVAWMIDLAKAFIQDNPDLAPEKMAVPDLFPAREHKPDKDSITLITSDVFGFEKLDQVYTADYIVNSNPMTAFISKRNSSEEAVTLAAEYAEFLVTFGGTPVESEKIHIVEIMETIEIVFSVGPYLAGVRESENLEASQILASEIVEQISRITASGATAIPERAKTQESITNAGSKK